MTRLNPYANGSIQKYFHRSFWIATDILKSNLQTDSDMNVIPIYAAILGIIFFILSVRIILLRRSLKIGLGDSGNPIVLRAMRVHSNFAEYVPLCLVLLGFAEFQGTLPMAVHALGSGLVLGRILHAYGVSQPKEDFRFRVTGMALTLTCLLLTCGTLIFNFLRSGII